MGTEGENKMQEKILAMAQKRKDSINTVLNDTVTVRQIDKDLKLNETTTRAKNITYKVDSEAVKKAVSDEYGLNIDDFLKSIKDAETRTFAKISTTNVLRKYTKENLKKFL